MNAQMEKTGMDFAQWRQWALTYAGSVALMCLLLPPEHLVWARVVGVAGFVVLTILALARRHG